MSIEEILEELLKVDIMGESYNPPQKIEHGEQLKEIWFKGSQLKEKIKEATVQIKQLIGEMEAIKLLEKPEEEDMLKGRFAGGERWGLLAYRWGLEDGVIHTLDDTGKRFKISRERVRQIENYVLFQLRHPSRLHNIVYLTNSLLWGEKLDEMTLILRDKLHKEERLKK